MEPHSEKGNISDSAGCTRAEKWINQDPRQYPVWANICLPGSKWDYWLHHEDSGNSIHLSWQASGNSELWLATSLWYWVLIGPDPALDVTHQSKPPAPDIFIGCPTPELSVIHHLAPVIGEMCGWSWERGEMGEECKGLIADNHPSVP